MVFLKDKLKTAYSVLKKISNLIQNTVNFILLIPVYIFGIGLVATSFKILGKSLLEIKRPKSKSYWKTRDSRLDMKDNEYRMF